MSSHLNFYCSLESPNHEISVLLEPEAACPNLPRSEPHTDHSSAAPNKKVADGAYPNNVALLRFLLYFYLREEHIELNCQMGGSASKMVDSYEDYKKSCQEPLSLSEMAGIIQELSKHIVSIISIVIESSKGKRNDQELYDLVHQFYSHSISMSAYCNEMESCLNKGHDSQLNLQVAVQLFEEGRGDGANGSDKYKRASEELEKFVNSKYPFTGLSEKLEKVRQQQDKLAEKLKLYEDKIQKKMTKTMIKQIAIAVASMFSIITVVSCQVYLVSAGFVLFVPKLALLTGAKVSPMVIYLIVAESECKKYYDQLKRQQDLVGLMKNHVLDEKINFDEIKMAAEKVENLLLRLKENAKFTLEGEEKLKIGFEDIKEKMDKFAKYMKNFGECIENCSEDLKKGREEIKIKMKTLYI